MDRTKQRNIIITALVLTAAAVIILITAGFAAKNRDYEPSSWVLKAYGNSVAVPCVFFILAGIVWAAGKELSE